MLQLNHNTIGHSLIINTDLIAFYDCSFVFRCITLILEWKVLIADTRTNPLNIPKYQSDAVLIIHCSVMASFKIKHCFLLTLDFHWVSPIRCQKSHATYVRSRLPQPKHSLVEQ